MLLRTATRNKTAVHGAIAIITRDGKMLLQRRREHIADPGTWVLPGGECRMNERPRETIVRVCSEELGITVRPSKEIGTIVIRESLCPVWHVIWKGKDVKLCGDDIVGIGWFTSEELLELPLMREQEEIRAFVRTNTFFGSLAGTSEQTDANADVIDQERVLALVERSKQGDHEAFAEIYDCYVTPIHRYAAFRLPPAIVEDIVADIFVKAWEKLDSYAGRTGTPFSSWLFRIAKNIVIDSYRSHKETVELDEFHIDEDRWNDPTLPVTQNMQTTLLRQAMNKLPKVSREVLLLSFMGNLSNAEIAIAMHRREGSIRILKHRALKKLAELLPASMREELP